MASDNLRFRFSTDGEGNYGYLGADGSFIPFKSGNPYLRYDEESRYVQVLDTDGNWVNVYKTESLPTISKYFIFDEMNPSADLLTTSMNAGWKPTLTVSGNIVIFQYKHEGGIAYCQGPLVEFDNYSKMLIEFEDFITAEKIIIGYSLDNSATSKPLYAEVSTYDKTSLANQTVEIDISNVSGAFYPTISIQMNRYGTNPFNMEIKNWYFTK